MTAATLLGVLCLTHLLAFVLGAIAGGVRAGGPDAR